MAVMHALTTSTCKPLGRAKNLRVGTVMNGSSGRGFGKSGKKAKKEEPIPGTTKKVRRSKSKGKSSMRFPRSQNYLESTASTAEKEEDATRLKKRVAAADAKTSGELTEDEIFAQRLADIKKDGKKKAAQLHAKETFRPSIYDEPPLEPEAQLSKKGADFDGGEKVEDVGPSKGVLVGLSVALVVMYLWVTVATA